jgi:hypothetical protein
VKGGNVKRGALASITLMVDRKWSGQDCSGESEGEQGHRKYHIQKERDKMALI